MTDTPRFTWAVLRQLMREVGMSDRAIEEVKVDPLTDRINEFMNPPRRVRESEPYPDPSQLYLVEKLDETIPDHIDDAYRVVGFMRGDATRFGYLTDLPRGSDARAQYLVTPIHDAVDEIEWPECFAWRDTDRYMPEILRAAARIIEDPNRYYGNPTGGARDQRNRPVSPYSDYAVRWNLHGAIHSAASFAHRKNDKHRTGHETESALAKWLDVSDLTSWAYVPTVMPPAEIATGLREFATFLEKQFAELVLFENRMREKEKYRG